MAMVHWAFFDYVSPMNVNQIAKWHRKVLSINEQAGMDALLGIMAKQKIWNSTDYANLSGKKYDGLGEIRWRGDQRKPLRLIGFQNAPNQFTLLIGCSHKDNVYTPADALDTAVTRKGELQLGIGSVCEHEI